jgi:spore maturation protein CgeB
VVSNSEGGLESLLALGARRAEAVFWGADAEFFAPLPVEKETDVFFYGYGDKFRRDWMGVLVGAPSRTLPDVDFALGGRDFRGDTGKARLVGDVPFNRFPRAIASARVNLCITRRSHATVYASSSCRPFELAAAGAAIVANPYDGLERWFEPGSELLVVDDAAAAVAAYRDLLDDPAQAEAMGQRARERVLDEHTYRHRARRLLELVGLGVPAGVD